MEDIVVDLQSPKNETVLNPRLPAEAKQKLYALASSFPNIDGHLWLTTSGSTGGPKLVAIAKQAILNSAFAVNTHLQASKSDRWLASLPLHHVGGLSILARAQLAGADCLPLPFWNPIAFAEACKTNQVTLTSLVPTQLFDLLSLDLKAPPSLRAIIIGGGKLSERLFVKAKELGWPVLPSFGSTEASSQIATASLDTIESSTYPPMFLLPHLTASTNEEGRLCLKGSSLFTGYAHLLNGEAQFVDPKVDGVFTSEDIVSLHETWGGITVTPKGRISDSVKISGELISFSHLNEILEEILEAEGCRGRAYAIAVTDPRLENRVALVGSIETSNLLKIRDLFSEKVLPVARPREVHHLETMPLSSLGKPLVKDIVTLVRSGKARKIYPL